MVMKKTERRRKYEGMKNKGKGEKRKNEEREYKIEKEMKRRYKGKI